MSSGGNGQGNGSDDGRPAARGRPIRMPGREATARPPPRRFYADVAVGPATERGAHPVLLDGRRARTPGKRDLALPTPALAEAVAAEWAAQATLIDPAAMPLTRLANTAIDGVRQRMAEVAADVVKFAGSDLLCYRADHPAGLARREAELWDPVLAWAEARLDTRFEVVRGVMHVAQPPAVGARLAAAVAPLDAFRLTALHVITTLTGSAILGLAVVEGQLAPEAAWQAAHVDEDWQIAEWGEDDEAAARRQQRHGEMLAAARLLQLLGPTR